MTAIPFTWQLLIFSSSVITCLKIRGNVTAIPRKTTPGNVTAIPRKTMPGNVTAIPRKTMPGNVTAIPRKTMPGSVDVTSIAVGVTVSLLIVILVVILICLKKKKSKSNTSNEQTPGDNYEYPQISVTNKFEDLYVNVNSTRKSSETSHNYEPLHTDSVKGKADSVKGKADSVKGKADSVKGKADSVKGKADSDYEVPISHATVNVYAAPDFKQLDIEVDRDNGDKYVAVNQIFSKEKPVDDKEAESQVPRIKMCEIDAEDDQGEYVAANNMFSKERPVDNEGSKYQVPRINPCEIDAEDEYMEFR